MQQGTQAPWATATDKSRETGYMLPQVLKNELQAMSRARTPTEGELAASETSAMTAQPEPAAPSERQPPPSVAAVPPPSAVPLPSPAQAGGLNAASAAAMPPPAAQTPTQKPPGGSSGAARGISLTAAPWARQSAVPTPLSAGTIPLRGVPVDPPVKTQARMPKPPDTPTEHKFRPAVKRITSEQQMAAFLRSAAVKEFVAFVMQISDAVRGKKTTDACEQSEGVLALCRVLDTLSAWVDDIPPSTQSLRYGNPAFRTWSARLVERADELLVGVVPEALVAEGALQELVPYLLDSFGNSTRIDYGTGHETNFAALLFCLAKLGVLREGDQQAIATVVFWKYLQLMRKVQITYWLEPAGSHGVWGLDDYQFLAFLWGASQLVEHPAIRPKSIHNPEILEAYSQDYLYLSCVQFTKRVKKGPLAETSPMVNDISGVPNWAKVNSGLIKMYQVEVLSKFPIMQHFLFGSLLPVEE